jgi:hypothetical protein
VRRGRKKAMELVGLLFSWISLFSWIGFVIVTALAASARGRDAFGWLILAMLFSPFALLAVLVLGKRETAGASTTDERRRILNDDGKWKCPWCFGEVDPRASACPHCGRATIPFLEPESASPRNPKDDSAGW